MTAALVAVSIALASALGFQVLLVTWLRSALRGESKARDELRAEQQRGSVLTTERDNTILDVARLESQLAEATDRLDAAERERNSLSIQVAQYEAGQIRNAPTVDAALDAFNAQLRRKQAQATPGPAAADGDRRPGDPVQAPTAPSAP